MKKLWILIVLVCSACTQAPQIASFFNEMTPVTPVDSEIMTSKRVTTVSMLLPLSGKQEETGLMMQKAALMALRQNPQSPVKLLFFDTQGTPEGTQEAYHWASAQNPDIVLGPVFASELSALPVFGPGVISYTSDSTLLSSKRASFAVLIADQVNQMVQYACQQGQRKLAVIGPENKVGEITMNALDEAIKKCPDMTLQNYALYSEKEENLSPGILKLLPKIVDPKKKDLTPEEQTILNTPMQDRLEFDSLFVFEEGVRLSQLMAIFAFYDVTPDIVPIYTLASVKTIKDQMLNGVLMMDLPESNTTFTRQYTQNFGQQPSRLATLAYDSVNWICGQAQNGIVHIDDLMGESFHGINGLMRLNHNGTNNRAMRLVRKKYRTVEQVQPAPTFLPAEEDTTTLKPIAELTDSASMSPEALDESRVEIESPTPTVSPAESPED